MPPPKLSFRTALEKAFEPELRSWCGRMPLWKVFWGYGVCASVVIIGLYAVAVVEHRLALQQTVLIFFALYTAWLLVAIWRCAERSAPQLNLIARLLTVAWAANAVMVVLFLQLDLITAALQS